MKNKEENNYIWDLDIEPKLDILDEEMTRYIEVCKEKLGMVPNVILANASDKERLRNLVQNHFRYTNSPKAKTVLDNFDSYLPKFIKVMPTEYKKVLIKMYEKNDRLKEVERGN